MSEGKATIVEKLVAIQRELKVPKSENGRFGKHRNVEGILTAVKPLLIKNKVALVMDSAVVQIGEHYYVKSTATLSDGNAQITSEAFAWEGDISRGLDAPQVTGAASSYSRKYALGGLFAIDDTKDPDSQDVESRPPITSKPLKAATPAPKPQKDSDPATPHQKQQLKNMMTALEMEADAMGIMVESVLGKPTVDTFADYKAVVSAMEETEDE